MVRFKPNQNRILVLPDPTTNETESGIVSELFLPNSSTGRVVAVGKGLYDDRKQCYVVPQVQVGDRIVYSKGEYELIEEDESFYLLMRDTDVYMANGIAVNDYIAVKWDEKHNRLIKLGDFEFERPKEWVIEQHDDKNLYDTNRDLKDTQPQIATVMKTNKKCNLKEGDTIYCHYLEYGRSVSIDIDGEMCSFISYKSIFFRINGIHDYEMAPYTYLGERVIDEAPRTESGIYLTPQAEVNRTSHIKITHVPENASRELGMLKVGDIAVTSDDFQYEINIHDKKMIKLEGQWIIGQI